MRTIRRLRIVSGLLSLVARGCDSGRFGVGAVDTDASGAAVAPGAGRSGERCRGPPLTRCGTCRVAGRGSGPTAGTRGELVPAAGEPGETRRVYAPKAPPAPVVERPSGVRPARNAQWIAGYWAWDTELGDFVWVGGSWQVPPEGSSWVAWPLEAGRGRLVLGPRPVEPSR